MPALVDSTHLLQPMDMSMRMLNFDFIEYQTMVLLADSGLGQPLRLLHDNWGYMHRRAVERSLMLALGIKGLVALCVCYVV